MKRIHLSIWFTSIATALLLIKGCPSSSNLKDPGIEVQIPPEGGFNTGSGADASAALQPESQLSAAPDEQAAPTQPQLTVSAEELFKEAVNLALTDPQKAIEKFREIARIKGDTFQIWYNIGVLYHRLGDWFRAEEAYKKALKLKPDFTPAIINIVRLYLQQNRLTAAQAYLEQKLRQFPNNTKLRNELIFLYIQRGDLSRSELMAREIQKRDEKNAEAIRNLGLIWLKQKKYDLATFAFDIAVKAKPEDPELRYYLALSKYKSEFKLEAIEDLQKALKMREDYPEAHNLLGLIYLSLPGKTKLAYKHFKRAAELMPSFYEAKLNMGIALKVLERADEAIKVFSELKKKYPYQPEPYYYLGILYLDYPVKERLNVSRVIMEVPPELRHNKKIQKLVDKVARYQMALNYLQQFVTRNPRIGQDHPVHDYIKSAKKKLKKASKKLKKRIKRLLKKLRKKKKKKTLSPPPATPSPPPSAPPPTGNQSPPPPSNNPPPASPPPAGNPSSPPPQ